MERVTGWSMRHPWKVTLGWLVMVAAIIAVGSSVATVKVSEADYRVGESGRADAMIAAAKIVDHPTEVAHITPRERTPSAHREGRTAADELSRAWKSKKPVSTVAEPQVSPRDGSLLVQATLKASVTDSDLDVSAMTADVEQLRRAHPELEIGSFGDVSTEEAVNAQVSHDLQRSEITSLPVTFVVMIAVFASLVAAGLPVIVAILSVAAAGGLSGVLSHVFAQEASVMSMIVLIGMAVGVDYCLFYLKREREERAAGRTPVDAVKIASRTSGHAIITSGCAVMISLSGLLIMDFAAFNSLALGAVSVTAFAVLASTTLLPALLAKLGPRVDRLRVPFLGHSLRSRTDEDSPPPSCPGLVQRLVTPVVNHPRLALALGALVVAALSAPGLGLRTMPGSIDSLPPEHPTLKAFNDVQRAFPSQGSVAQIVLRDDGKARAQISDITNEATHRGWTPKGTPDARGGLVRVDLATPFPIGSEALKQDVGRLRSIVDAKATGSHGVTGDAAQAVDMADHLDSRMPWAIGAVLAMTSLMMAWAFRSTLIGVLTTMLNLASAGVAFGVLAAVFQTDAGTRLMNVTDTGAVRDWVPMFLFSVLVGLSMDYHVFVLSRIRENVEAGMPTRSAIAAGVGRTGPVVTAAAVVMVAVFSIFATLGLSEMKQIGLGLAVAIAIDATVIRLVLLPAALSLGGRRFWRSRERRTRTNVGDELAMP